MFVKGKRQIDNVIYYGVLVTDINGEHYVYTENGGHKHVYSDSVRLLTEFETLLEGGTSEQFQATMRQSGK